MREYGVSQLPVVKAEPPVMAAEVVGVRRRNATCSTRCSPGGPSSATPWSSTCRPPLPVVGSGEPVSRCVELLQSSGAVVVLEDGKPSGILTRQDLLAHLAS